MRPLLHVAFKRAREVGLALEVGEAVLAPTEEKKPAPKKRAAPVNKER
jgi:hypothetical protein